MEAATSYTAALQQERLSRQTVVLTSCFSPDGAYLVCGDVFGKLAVWRLEPYLNDTFWATQTKESVSPLPSLSFQAHRGPVYALLFLSGGDEEHVKLVSGGDDEVSVWDWMQVVTAVDQTSAAESLSPLASLRAPQGDIGRGSLSARAETNAMAVDGERGRLFAASGDGNVYVWDTSTGGCVATMRGHSDSVLCAGLRPLGGLVTGSEDGTVRLWDPRCEEATTVLDPFQSSKKHPSFNGKRWIAALAVHPDDTYVVCGGGARMLSLWHLASLVPVSVMPTIGEIQDVSFSDGQIISVGSEPHIVHWKTNGSLLSRVCTSSPSLFTVHSNPRNKILIAGGSSPYVDVFFDSRCKTFSFLFE